MFLSKYGIKEWFGLGIIAFILICIFLYIGISFEFVLAYLFACIVFVIWLGIAAFFRDPIRTIPSAKNIITSPADGVVKDIEIIKNVEFPDIFEEEYIRVGIFLSVFNVHINRVPCDFTVRKVIYTKGKFHDARSENAIKENESNIVFGEGIINEKSYPIGIKQISGAIAKRIVCPVKFGDKFKKGEKYGMIKFGSRTELYLPTSMKIKVRIGDKVKAGITICAAVD